MTDEIETGETLRLTTDIVAAYLSQNSLQITQVPDLIVSVYRSLTELNGGDQKPEVETKRTPAVPVRKSVTPDFIICLEDGKKLITLKRHLRSKYDMSPQEYRAKWGLPADYPMVAPNYAARRSEMAKQIGLGQHGRSEDRKSRR